MGNFYETIAEEVEKLNQTKIKTCPMLKKDGVDWSVCNDVRVGGECLNCQKGNGTSEKTIEKTNVNSIIEKLEDLLRGALFFYSHKERVTIIIKLYEFLDRKWKDEIEFKTKKQ